MTWICAAEAVAQTRDPLPAAQRDSVSDPIPHPPEPTEMIEKTTKTRGLGDRLTLGT